MNVNWRSCLLASSALALLAGPSAANDELIKLQKDPNQWVMPTGDYANHRYSTLSQINKDNVKNLRIAWRFRTDNLGPRPDSDMDVLDRRSARP
jgi:glucose dehydrogenase